jgi:hypothetical protein
MTLILSGTDGVSDIDGTAATPAIRGTDANTGIFFGTDIIGFSEGGTEAMRINASGNLQTIGTIGVGNATPSTSGAGITFPATQSASSDANTLDDYEEGTFTPVVNGGVTSPTYSNRFGRYVKIGSRVFFDIRVELSGGTGNSAQISMNGFPFTSSTSLPNGGGYSTYVDIGSGNPIWYMSDNATQIQGYLNGGSSSFTTTGSVTSKFIIISGSYSTST